MAKVLADNCQAAVAQWYKGPVCQWNNQPSLSLTDKMWKLFSRKKECSTTAPELCTGLKITGKEKAIILFVILHLLILLLNLFFFLRPEPEKKVEEKSGWF